VRLILTAVIVALTAGCSSVPSVRRENALMTPKEIADAGLVCKQITPIDTNVPKTMCASEKTWAAYEAKTRRATEELLAEGRKQANAGRYNRN